ncbi:MAG TPA: FG-GAP-like repeat-containing protein, partial [Blastocatellia bacterium]|nr:FG-GAP-like repeat-containing protein [Blastocatellia bacterium]
MLSLQRFSVLLAIAVAAVFAATGVAVSTGAASASPQAAAPSAREQAYRANNLGVALLEQFKHKEGAEEFRRALRLDPKLAIARVNLAIALYNIPEIEGALREAQAAAQALPAAPQPHYLLGLIAKTQNRVPDAVAAFQRVLQIDPNDVGANVNLGQLYAQQRKYDEAIKLFRTALDSEVYNVTATYNLALSLLRGGQREEGQRMMQRFQTLRDGGYGTSLGTNYLEQGQYAEAISSTGAEADLVDTATPDVKFVDATPGLFPTGKTPEKSPDSSSVFGRQIPAGNWNDAAKQSLAAAFGGGVTLFDYDSDGDLDMLEVVPAALRLYRNDSGKFADVTEQSGLASIKPGAVGIGAVAGDYDNDNKPDLFVLRYGGNLLLHNDGNGKFSDATTAAEIPAYPHLSASAAFVDIDHDGDLDIFIAGLADLSKAPTGEVTFPDGFAPAPNLLLRNNGNGKFTDTTATAKVAGPTGHAVAVVPTDYDNRRDIDLLILHHGEAPVLFRNLRDGSFRDVAAEVGLTAKGRFTSAAAGDVNKDGYTDFYFGATDGPGMFAMSNKGRFAMTAAPAGVEGASAAQFFDYDNDGLLDLVTLAKGGARVLRNLGDKWADVSDAVRGWLPAESAPRAFAAGDVDGDADTDIIARLASGEIKAGRNEGGSRNASVRVQLAGLVSNR